ncbi:MAG: ribose-phosphate pyrophosphokinase [Alteraurantiacibacter sp.]
MDRSLGEFLDANGLAGNADWSALHDVSRITAMMHDAAKSGCALSYSEALGKLGFRFTRPKMRALCKTLDAVDRNAADAGEPELAVLVVRESDGLPGQGWWTGRRDFEGEWTGAEARRFVERLQALAFTYWQ